MNSKKITFKNYADALFNDEMLQLRLKIKIKLHLKLRLKIKIY